MRRVYQQRPSTAKITWGAKPTAKGGKEPDMRKMPTATETAVKEAKKSERLKLLLIVKEAKSLEELTAVLEKLINQD